MNNLTNLFDKRSIFNTLGCLIKEPTLLEEYKLMESDFDTNTSFYKVVFFAVNNLFYQGVKQIDIQAIDALLASHTKAYKVFQENNGLQYCATALEQAQPDNFKFYYTRIRKFAYLRYMELQGIDTRIIYDTTIIDPNLAEKELKRFDEMSINGMIDLLENKLIIEPRSIYADENSLGQQAGKGMRALKERLKQEPEFGIPLQSDILTTIARGARQRKFYLRSSGTGGGKSRTGMGDCCNFAIPQYYDTEKKQWIIKGQQEPTLFISAELEMDELQTLAMAYISGVDEEHIIDGNYINDEENRVDKAIDYIENNPIYFEFMPDFGIQDIRNKIKYYYRKFGVRYICIDYIHMSAKLIMEMASMSQGMKLREDQILFLFVDTIKNMCNQMNIFILAMTQLNGSYKDAVYKDETLLRGAKSMADRIDLGEISLKPTNTELEAITPILAQSFVIVQPNLVRHCYKVRKNKLTRIKIWQKADLGTCRTKDLFVTDYDNNLIEVDVKKLTPKQIDEIIDKHSTDLEEEKEEDTDSETKTVLFNF